MSTNLARIRFPLKNASLLSQSNSPGIPQISEGSARVSTRGPSSGSLAVVTRKRNSALVVLGDKGVVSLNQFVPRVTRRDARVTIDAAGNVTAASVGPFAGSTHNHVTLNVNNVIRAKPLRFQVSPIQEAIPGAEQEAALAAHVADLAKRIVQIRLVVEAVLARP